MWTAWVSLTLAEVAADTGDGRRATDDGTSGRASRRTKTVGRSHHLPLHRPGVSLFSFHVPILCLCRSAEWNAKVPAAGAVLRKEMCQVSSENRNGGGIGGSDRATMQGTRSRRQHSLAARWVLMAICRSRDGRQERDERLAAAPSNKHQARGTGEETQLCQIASGGVAAAAVDIGPNRRSLILQPS